MMISIITPVYNEEENITRFYNTLIGVVDGLSDLYDFEIIFTDNNSSDRTREKVLELIARDSRIRYVKLSRNFGYQRSIWTGYSISRGSAAIELDADLEDDPQWIPKMISLWKDGARVVYGIRAKRAEPSWLQSIRKIYYRLLNAVSHDDIPVDAGDFMLLDRSVIDLLKKVRDPNVYIRGFVFSLGFKRIGFLYSRNERVVGKSKFNLSKMVSLATDAFIRHSATPLRLSSYVAAALSVALVLLAVSYTFIKQIFGSDWPPGFATIIIFQLISTAATSLFIGVLGEYVWRIYRILNNEPMSLIEYEINDKGLNADFKDV